MTLTAMDILTVTLELHTPPYQYHTSIKIHLEQGHCIKQLKENTRKSNHQKVTTVDKLKMQFHTIHVVLKQNGCGTEAAQQRRWHKSTT